MGAPHRRAQGGRAQVSPAAQTPGAALPHPSRQMLDSYFVAWGSLFQRYRKLIAHMHIIKESDDPVYGQMFNI